MANMNNPNGTGMAASNSVNATRQGLFPGDEGAPGGDKSQGEVGGAGSIYSAALNERPNISNNRNQGPSRSASRMGTSSIPVMTQARRNTGRVG